MYPGHSFMFGKVPCALKVIEGEIIPLLYLQCVGGNGWVTGGAEVPEIASSACGGGQYSTTLIPTKELGP